MTKKLSLQLSDGLADLRAQFEEFTSGSRVLEPYDARTFVAVLKILYQQARDLENEVSRNRWNDCARGERKAEERAIAAEVMRPGSNVALFPIIRRPFSDDRPGGAA